MLSVALVTAAASQVAAQSLDGGNSPSADQPAQQGSDDTEDVTEGLLPDALGPDGSNGPGLGAVSESTEVAYPNLGSQLSALAAASDPDVGSDRAADSPTLPDGTNSTSSGQPLLLTLQLDGNRDGVLGFLDDNGVTPANVVGDYVEAYVPPDLLAPLAQQTGVARVRETPQAFKDLGSVTSGGVRAHGADVWHDNGYTGDGVKVGVIDTSTTTTSKDGFTGLRALRGTELPATVVGRCYIDAGKPTSDLANCDTAGGDQHGTAVAESLMDVAPDAALYISNPLTWADLHSSVVWMHGQGVKIINFSVSWSFHGAPDGTSPVSPSPLNTAKWAVDNGMTWVNSAGNYGKRAWFGSFADSDNDGYHEWAGSGATADEAQVLELDASDSVFVNMRWDDTWGGATKDLDLEVRYSATQSGAQTVVGTSADVQKGGAADYPWEGISLTAANSGFYWVYAKKKTASAAPTWVQFMVFGQISEIEHYTPEGGSVTSPGDSSSPGVLAVGAGGATHYWVPRAYSSRGPTPDGRTKPDVAGLDCEPTSLGRFCGTSQAAPHVAGLAALVVERNPTFTPSQVADYLRTNADERHGLYPSGWGHGFAWLNSGDFAKEDDGCWTPLSGSGNFTAIWSGPGPDQLSLGASAAEACKSQGRAGSYARYFGFTLDQQTAVTIDLSSWQDGYLLLRSGRNSRTAETVLYRDDSGGLGGSDARIAATLPAGDYTIEATTDTGPPATGLFTLGVQGVPSQAWAQTTTQISIEADGDVTEGSDAVFTLSASPPPSSPLTVDVAVSSDGDFGITADQVTTSFTGHESATSQVTISTSGTGTLTMPTTDDKADEADGSVTATVMAAFDPARRYAVSTTSDSATVAIADDELPDLTCVTALTGDGDVSGEWIASCASVENEGLAQFYAFTLGQQSKVTLDLTSPALGYIGTGSNYPDLMVRNGRNSKFGSVAASGWGSRSPLIKTTLPPGDYMIEATSWQPVAPGTPFVLTVSGIDSGSSDPCVSALQGNGSVDGAWTGECDSEGRSASHGRFYTFSLDSQAEVTIDLESSKDTYLFLRSGLGRDGPELYRNDDGGDGYNSRISETLAAGDYTIEATTFNPGLSGTFVLTVAGLPTKTSPQSEPEISIAAGTAVAEGGDASFTVTATPKPAADLDVTVSVSQSGDFGVTTGSRTVTIPASGSETFTVATADDSVDEADGSVTATVGSGTGYTVSSTQGAASVAVSDDDVPEISIAAGSGVAEGTAASFTLTASPKPAAGLDVTVAVSQSGDFDAATGSRTVTIPTSGSFALTVTTSDDSVDEADGSVTATISTGTGYTVSSLAGSASVAVSDDDVPEISIAAGSGVFEGTAASFTLTASPKPAAGLDVTVAVSQSGDFGVSAGSRTVTVPASGVKTFSVATSGDGDDEADGSVTATVKAGSGYSVSSGSAAATVVVADDDDGGCSVVLPDDAVSVDEITGWRDGLSAAAAAGVKRFNRVLAALGTDTGHTPMTAEQAAGVAGWLGNSRWDRIARTLAALEQAQCEDSEDDEDEPQISIVGGAGVVEGSAASFTVTASPAPAVGLDVTISVSRSGDFGAATGTRTVTIPASGSYTLTVATTGDGIDEADGSVTVSVDAGTGYTVSSSAGSASVAVADNDVPEVGVAAGSGITEGANATFTVTAAPTPYAALPVELTVSASGDFGAATGTRTVTIPTSGSYTLAVATTGDSTDEADGSVSVSVSGGTGTGYTVSSSAGSATVAVSDDDDPPPTVPEISIAAGSAVTEGTAASFTLTANPTPVSALTVSVTVAQSGDFAATGERTFTIPTTGTATFTVATTDDTTDEADGSVTATVGSGTGYTVSSTQSAATVAVSDDDDPPPVPADCVSDETLESARDYYDLNRDRAPGFGRNWRRVLIAFGDVTDDQLTAMTAAEALEREQLWFGWRPFREALECIEAARQTPPPPAEPEISIAAGGGVTEGSSASFTLTASPAPTTALAVDVTVSQSGDFGVTTGARTVTIPTAGTFTLTVDTTGDSIDEADGSVTVTVDTGTGYTVSSSAGSATVAVSDDDDPAPPPTDPEISVAAGSGVTEGGDAIFTVMASPAPASALSVSVTVAQSGDYGVSAGARTVTIPIGGSYTLTVATADDSIDEADGSVTVTVDTGTGYTVSLSAGSATVAVSDDDDPAPPPTDPEISITAGSDVTEGTAATFTLTASPAPTTSVDVSVTVSQSGSFATTGERTVTIPRTGTATFTVATTDDTTDEADGSVTATVGSGTGYTVSSSASAATVAVSDNDPASAGPPTVTVSDATVVEGAQGLAFAVTLSKPNPVPITFRYGGYGRTATLWQDWSIEFRRTFTLAAGDTAIDVTVPVIDDDTPEDSETLRVYVYATSGIVIRDGFLYATGTITDDD